MVSGRLLRWAGATAFVALTALTGCGGSGDVARITGPDDDRTDPHALAKTIGEAASSSQTVVEVTVTRDGSPVEGIVALSRSTSGRALDYRWSGTTGAGGVAEIQITSTGLRSVSGYYLAEVTDPATGQLLGTWGSIPINAGRRTVLSLPVGGSAQIESSTRLIFAPEDNRPDKGESRAIPFESLKQGSLYSVSPNMAVKLASPSILLADNADHAASLLELGDADITRIVQGTDYERVRLIVVFRGRLSTAGYGITVTGIQGTAGSAEVQVRLTDPGRDEMTAQVLTYPYHIITVLREDPAVGQGTAWTVRTSDGKLLLPKDTVSRPPIVPGDGTVPIGTVTDDAQPGDNLEHPGMIGPPITAPPATDVVPGDTVVGPDGSLTSDAGVTLPAEGKIDIRGTITTTYDAADDAKGLLGALLIEGPVQEDTRYDRARATVTTDTRISEQVGDSRSAVTYQALTTGQKVQVLFTGPVMESYPVQATALEIVILK
jgi:hypothetical protein